MSLSSRRASLGAAVAVAFAALTVTVTVARPAAADGPASSGPTYYRLVHQVPMRKEVVLAPSLTANRLAERPGAGRSDFRNVNAFTERLFESARRQAAPNLPSRGESTFITPGSSVAYWRTQIRSAPTLVEVRPVDPRRVTTRDVAHLDRTVAFVRKAFAPSTTAPERAGLLRKAHAAAVDYWTKEPGKDSHVETLAGGGAVYVRRAENDPPRR